jgi:membrane protease YdiL (CAAX protease family)
MTKRLNGFQATLGIGWVALCAAGVAYARFAGFPWWAAGPALAAFLIEYSFYLVPAFPEVRERFAGWRLPAFLVAGAALPYLACCCGAIPFQWISLGKLVAVALALGLWYFALPAKPLADLGFLAFTAALVLSKFFKDIYPVPFPKVELSILGKLAVFQSAVLVMMLARRVPETGYGFWPKAREWRIGALNFLWFAPVGVGLALGLHAVRFAPDHRLWLIAATFFGRLWAVVLGEEFFFRGVLQPQIEKWLASRHGALLLTSALFGLVHLPFGGFPNWRWVAIAGTMGWFCGRARNQAGNIRAAMVTHTLTVTALQAFFQRI